MPLVLTIDQRRSRRSPSSEVEALVQRLNSSASVRTLRPFERTVGDELQGILSDAGALAPALGVIAREPSWWVGLGAGPIEELGTTARESTGTALHRARDAVERAKKLPWGVAVEGGGSVSAADLEAALALWTTLLGQRTRRGWEAVDLRAEGLSEAEIARRLGISQQAVNQRLKAAFEQPDAEGVRLIERLAARALDEAGT